MSPMPPAAQLDTPAAQRWLRASGLLVPVLFFVSDAFAPNPPVHGGTDAALLAFYRDHHAGILTGVFAGALAMVALLSFSVAVVEAAAAARRAAGRSPVASGVVGVFAGVAGAMMMASQAATGATAVIGAHATDAGVVRGLDEIAHMLAHIAMLPLGILVLAMGLTLTTARAGARAVAVAGAVAGGALALTSSWVFVGGSSLHNLGVLAFFATFLWCVVQSVVLVRAGRPARLRDPLTAPTAPVPA